MNDYEILELFLIKNDYSFFNTDFSKKTFPKNISSILKTLSDASMFDARLALKYCFFCQQNNFDFDPMKYETIIFTSPLYSFIYAAEIKGANIKKCQEIACKDPFCALMFAKEIPQADLNMCEKAVINSTLYQDFIIFISKSSGAMYA